MVQDAASIGVDQRLYFFLVAEEQEVSRGVTHAREGGALNDDLRGVIAAHGIQRQGEGRAQK
jgi:hypothetical protein